MKANVQHDNNKQTKKRALRLASLGMAAGIVASLTVSSAAITPTYRTMTDAFRGSRYYLNLQTLNLTGDARTDIIMVAMSQLGYHEGNYKSHCNGESRGNGNFVEYNYYNGSVDQLGNGRLTYGYPWCASFVTYCARMAEISPSVLPGSLNCTLWVRHFRSVGQFRERASGYVPRQGDLIFFRDAGSNTTSTHVGLVRYVCGGLVYTIEGNQNDQVSLACYDVNSTYIVGYGVPSYGGDGSLAIDYLLDEYKQGNYIIAAQTLPVRKSPSYSAAVTFTLHRGDLMHIYECRAGWGRTDYGWIPMTDTQPIDVEQ